MLKALAFWCGIIFCAFAASAAEETDILEQWARRETRFQTAMFVTKAEVSFKAGSKGPSRADPSKVLPLTDVTLEENHTLFIDRKTGRIRRNYRSQVWNADLEVFQPAVGFAIFDGIQFARVEPHADNRTESYQPPPSQPELYLSTGTGKGFPLLSQLLSPSDAPIYYCLGLVFPFRDRDAFRSMVDLRPAHVSFSWKETEQGKVAKLIGKDERFSEELLVRPDWQGAVTSLKVSLQSGLAFTLKVDYDHSADVPMPKSWLYTPTNPKWSLAHWTVVRYEFDIPFADELFRIPLEGKKVIVKDRKLFEVSPDGTLIPNRRAGRP